LLAWGGFIDAHPQVGILILVARGHAERADVGRPVVPLPEFIRVDEMIPHSLGRVTQLPVCAGLRGQQVLKPLDRAIASGDGQSDRVGPGDGDLQCAIPAPDVLSDPDARPAERHRAADEKRLIKQGDQPDERPGRLEQAREPGTRRLLDRPDERAERDDLPGPKQEQPESPSQP